MQSADGFFVLGDGGMGMGMGMEMLQWLVRGLEGVGVRNVLSTPSILSILIPISKA